MYVFVKLWYMEYLICSACPLQFIFIAHGLTSVSAVLMVLAFWDTVQISSVIPSFTLEEPLGLLIIKMKSNFYTKLSKHLIGLWGAILILSTTEESSTPASKELKGTFRTFQCFKSFMYCQRGFLNIFKKKMFSNK